MKNKIFNILMIVFAVIVLFIALIDRAAFTENYYYYITILFWSYVIVRRILDIVERE